MNKHTPGPWTNHGRIPQPGLPHSTVVAKTLIARVYSEAFGDIEQEEANAHLVAAAPELLEALQMYVESMRDAFSDFGHFGSPVYKAAVSAISKATGEKIDYEPEQQDRVHAELRAQYAEDAKTHAKPWELWQFLDRNGWNTCFRAPGWFESAEYRRKPLTVRRKPL